MKIIKWLFISVFGLAGLVAGAFFAFRLAVFWSVDGVGSDGGVGSAFLRAQFHDGPRYYELTAQLDVEGKPVEVKRVIECLPYFAHRIGNYFQKRWYTNQEAMTHRLPNGSGVIVVVPQLCEEFAYPQPSNASPWKAFPDLPEDFVPLIFWTANADNPEVLEGYHSFDSVERPGSRIHFRGIELKNGSDFEPQVYPEEFGVWNNAKFGGLFGDWKPRRKRNYRGFYLIEVNKEQWSLIPELVSEIRGMDKSGILNSEAKIVLERNFQMHSNLDQYAIDGDFVPRQKGNRQSSRFGPSFEVAYRMRSFTIRDDSLVSITGKNGVILYFREDVINSKNILKNGHIKININENTIIWSTKKINDAYYQLKSGKIYEIEQNFIDFRDKSFIDSRGR